MFKVEIGEEVETKDYDVTGYKNANFDQNKKEKSNNICVQSLR